MEVRGFSRYIYFIFLLLIVLAVGCTAESGSSADKGQQDQGKAPAADKQETGDEPQDNEETDESRANIQEVLVAPTPPETMEALMSYESGSLSGEYLGDNREEVEKVLAQLPEIHEVDSEETVSAYWNKLLSLFAEPYPNLQTVVDEWKLSDFGNPDLDDARLQFKKNYNVEILLDASGSMAGVIDGQTKMTLAKQAIREFAAALPEEANVALRVYGHKGSNADADKEVSCGSSELVYDMQAYNADQLGDALSEFEPTGWTPIAASLQKAQNDLSAFSGEQNTNIVYLVSDGVETCDGDPVKAAKELAQSGSTPIVNVIGFDVGGEGIQALQAIADAADGHYATVHNQAQLQQEFDRSLEIATKWLEWKVDADYANITNQVNRESTIHEFNNAWNEMRNREHRNLSDAIRYLHKNGKIPMEVQTKMKAWRQERYKLVDQLRSQAYEDLMTLSKESYQEMEQTIDEKYEQSQNE